MNSSQTYPQPLPKGKGVIVAVLALLSTIGLACGAEAAGRFDASSGTIIDERWKSGVPLGGIGDGKIEVLTDGSFGNFTNQGNWDRPYGWAKGAFAAIRVSPPAPNTGGTGGPLAPNNGGTGTVVRMLRLKSDGEYDVDNIAHTRMQGWFPRASVDFVDGALPVDVRLKAWSPLVPHDVKNSSIPVACLDYVVTNTSRHVVKASVVLAWPNLLGWGGRGGVEYNDLSGDTQSTASTGNLVGVKYTTSQTYIDQHANAIGQYFLGVRREPGVSVTRCTSWDTGADTPAFWHQFAETGSLPSETDQGDQPAAAVDATVELAPRQSKTLHFYVVWAMRNFILVNPNRTWTDRFDSKPATIPSLAHEDGSRWTTDRGMHTGDNLVIDLGQVCTPTSFTMDNGKAVTDYPRGLKVESSVDGATWLTVAKLSKDDLFKAVNTVDLKPMQGRYLKLTNLGDEGLFWSIYGMAVTVAPNPNNGLPPAPNNGGSSQVIDPVTATANLVHFEEHTTYDQAGHFWQRYWDNAASIAAYVDKNADSLLAETRSWQDPVMASNVPFWLKLKLINCAFPMYSNTVLTKDGRYSVLESPIEMGGALGTMDQRMASHAFMTAFFPELDRTELEQYATCQMPDGRITHFDGNVHQVMVDGDVNYGITDWPDLSASWIFQVAKLYRWTGDKAFLNRVQPHITRAMDWLRQDGDGDDHIPVGGSTYDYQSMPRGAFVYSASCYLGALRAAAAVASPSQAAVYDREFAQTQAATMRDLWTGTYFRKWEQPNTGEKVDDSFIANLAGDWMTRISGLPSTLDGKVVRQSLAQTIARHQKPFFPIPPMQVTVDGDITTSSCYTLQHEPYLGCEAIYGNYVDDGLDTIHRVYFAVWEENQSPWDESLCYDASNGRKGGLPTYMTCPTTWFVVDALGGTSIDVPSGRLYISPRLTTGESELHIPVYFSRFWGRLDYVPAKSGPLSLPLSSRKGSAGRLTLTVTKVFGPSDDLQKTLYHTAGTGGDGEPESIVIRSIAADGDSRPVALSTPFTVKSGAVLDLSAYAGRLSIPRKSDVVDFMVKAKVDRPGLPADKWILTDNTHDNPVMSRIIGQDALDGNEVSRWTTGRSLQPGDSVTLDMGAAQTVSRMVLDSSQYPGDYPQGYTVDASVDGKSWKQIAHQTGQETMAAVQNGVLTIDFPSTNARYLRVTSVGGHSLWWSIAELSVYGAAGSTASVGVR